MSILFGPDALEYRLQNSGASAIILDLPSAPNLAPVRANCPLLKHVILVGSNAPDLWLRNGDVIEVPEKP